MDGLLKAIPDVTVYFPATFPMIFKGSLTRAGIKTVEVNDPARICKGIYSTGVMESWMKEQSLIISTDRGLIVITGCAHPGIVNILKIVKELNVDNILLVMGGFHLGAMRKAQFEEIIAKFRELGVEKVGSCHCTGELAKQTFKQEYGKDFLDVGVGRRIEFE
jgi:7,8-dihydropterin-6-yl-methyl-4-(beta-D-ribofuranosyl)aminobenzene 5'-phosphate synthase